MVVNGVKRAETKGQRGSIYIYIFILYEYLIIKPYDGKCWSVCEMLVTILLFSLTKENYYL